MLVHASRLHEVEGRLDCLMQGWFLCLERPAAAVVELLERDAH